jgi:RNA polymerase sigma-70 factor (ECF subfamily)
MRDAPTAKDDDSPTEELALVRRALEGDRQAFDRIMERATPALFRFASPRLNRDRETTREIVQATMVKVVENLDSFRGESRLLTWMVGICRFEILAHYRAKKRDAGRLEVDEEIPSVRAALGAAHAGFDQPGEELERAERRALVHLALDQLPERYAHALEWKYLEGLPVREIAERLGLELKAAESVLTRARSAFRAAFDQLGADPATAVVVPREDGGSP